MNVEFSVLSGRRSRAAFTPYRAAVGEGKNTVGAIPTAELIAAAEVVWERLAETSGRNWKGYVVRGKGNRNTFVAFHLTKGKGDDVIHRFLKVDRASLQIVEDSVSVVAQEVGQP
ncbi:hypothetical protein ACFRAQ_35940 [Nocardia sp. NPDC056611]|uniref:hypothetical protein n=1 Tax=Nocardia sp. NPDC056611 TaxID=3345877 RepID=UPI003671B037